MVKAETELQYMTISFIYNAITEITNRIISSSKINLKEIDLTNPIIIFNNDISIKNPDDDDKIDDHLK
ncbi:16580_t:CDS:2 [Funneliformis caledonium]|uniref:16580_t:CDS:1 n=1 Tax=Funneliformis caledonium TaxID=1117310 RepID=A0A9N8ZHW1_9GLOM|nr:16580_t:CDS:2 [Funneliformis caledonium]